MALSSSTTSTSLSSSISASCSSSSLELEKKERLKREFTRKLESITTEEIEKEVGMIKAENNDRYLDI